MLLLRQKIMKVWKKDSTGILLPVKQGSGSTLLVLLLIPVILISVLGIRALNHERKLLSTQHQAIVESKIRSLTDSMAREVWQKTEDWHTRISNSDQSAQYLREIAIESPAIKLITRYNKDGTRLYPPESSVELTFSETLLTQRFKGVTTRLRQQLTDTHPVSADTVQTGSGTGIIQCWQDIDQHCIVFDEIWVRKILEHRLHQHISEPSFQSLPALKVRYGQSRLTPTRNHQEIQAFALPYPLHQWQLICPENCTTDKEAGKQVNHLILAYIATLSPVFILMLVLALRLNRQHRHEQDKAKDKITFLSQLAHELRTPLTNMYLYTDLIRQQAKDPQSQQYCKILDEESARLNRLIDNALLLSRPSTSTQALTSCVPDWIIQERIKSFSPRLQQENIKTNLTLNSCQTIRLNHQALDITLSNLLDNTIKYAPGSCLTIQSEFRHTWLIISFHDTGPGISQETLYSLFEPFQPSDTRKQGFGLGLSACKRMLQQAGGDIGYQKDDRGCHFVISLPCSENTDLTQAT